LTILCVPKECDLKNVIITEPPTKICEDSYSLGTLTTNVVAFVHSGKDKDEKLNKLYECIKKTTDTETINKQKICYYEGTKPDQPIISK